MNQTYSFSLTRFAAFEPEINFDLFNASVQLAIMTTESSKQVPELIQQLRKFLWYKKVNAMRYFEPHGIRYLGELLERYAEKIGDEPRNLRAVALAFACTLPIHTDNMFVSAQKAQFMNILTAAPDDDIYILCARCMLADDSTRGELEDLLLSRTYNQTEHLTLALCALSNRPDAWERLHPQTVRLFTAARTIPVEGNAGIFAWVVNTFHKNIRACRKADNAPLRALLKLDGSYVRSHHREHSVLTDAGYTPWDILYLNTCFLWEEKTRFDHLCASSIPAEKMCAEFIAETLNAGRLPSPNTLEYIYWLVQVQYWNLEIKIEGCTSIWQYLRPSLNIISPDILAWMYKSLYADYRYRFDVLDSKWDILTTLLSKEEYHALFRDQLLSDENSEADTIRSMLERYQKLTGANYSNAFTNYDCKERDAFCLLAGCGVIDLWKYFKAHRENRAFESPVCYLWPAIEGVSSRIAFEFWQKFFSENTPAQVGEFWPSHTFHEPFRRRSSYGYRTLPVDFLRPFLSAEENRQLVEWLDQSIFVTDAGSYDAFVSGFLGNEDTYKLYTADELRPVFDKMLTLHPEYSELRSMKSRFMSESELLADKQAAERRRAEQEAKEHEAFVQRLQQEADAAFDGTLPSLLHHISRQGDWREQRRIVLAHTMDRLPDIIRSVHPMTRDKLASLMFICGWLIQYDLMTVPDSLTLLSELESSAEQGEKKAC